MFKLNFDGMFSEFYEMMCTDIFANFEKIVFINQKKVGVGIVRCDLPLPSGVDRATNYREPSQPGSCLRSVPAPRNPAPRAPHARALAHALPGSAATRGPAERTLAMDTNE